MNTTSETPRVRSIARQNRGDRNGVFLAILFILLATACAATGDRTDAGPNSTTTATGAEAKPGAPDDDDEANGTITTTTGPTSTTTEATTTTEGGERPDPALDAVGPETLSPVERDYATALQAAMADEPTTPEAFDTECLAEVWVGSIGEEQLRTSGLDADEFAHEGPLGIDLDRETARTMHRRSIRCGFTAEVVAAELLGCPDTVFDDEEFEALMIATFTGDVDDDVVDLALRFEDGCW